MLKLDKEITVINLNTRSIITIGGCLAVFLLFVNFVWLYKTVPYSSDDAALLAMVHFFDLGQLPSWMPPDTYIFKLPFNGLAQLLFGHTTLTMFVSALLANVFAIVLALIASLKMLGKLAQKEAFTYIGIFLAYATIPAFNFMYSLRNPHIRTIEVGLALLIIALITQYWYKGRGVTTRNGIFASGFLGLFFYNDPGFIFFIGIPVILFTLYRYVATKKISYKYVATVFMAGLIVFKILSSLLGALGFFSYPAKGFFPTLEQLGASLPISGSAILAFFNADFLGMPTDSPHTLLRLLYAPLLLLGVIAVYWAVRWGSEAQKLLGVVCVVTIAAFIFSDRPIDLYSARYVVIVPFILPLLVYGAMRDYFSQEWRIITGYFIGLIVFLNILTPMYRVFSYPSANFDPNAIANDVAKIMHDNSLQDEKGYGGYFMANINSYISDTSRQIVPLLCDKENARVYHWVMYEGYVARPSERSYIIVSDDNLMPANITHHPDAIQCTQAEARAIFGEPHQVYKVRANTAIYHYDYDIGTKLRHNSERP